MIIENPNKNMLTKEQEEVLLTLSTEAIADAIGSMGYSYGQALPGSIRSIDGGAKKMVGLATTVYAPKGNSLPFHLAIYLYAKNRVLVVATDSYEYGPYMGAIMAMTAMQNGASGIVIDGHVRDMEQMRQLNLPIYAKGSIPNQPTKEDEGSINEDIQLGNAVIRNGDVLVGDATGVVAIPFEILDAVIEKAVAKEKRDEERYEASYNFDYANAFTPEDYLSIMTPAVAEYIKLKEK